MKINVMNEGVLRKDVECHLNPAAVCVAERKNSDDGCKYFLHTMDGGIWEVTMEDYMNVIAWIEVWIERRQ